MFWLNPIPRKLVFSQQRLLCGTSIMEERVVDWGGERVREQEGSSPEGRQEWQWWCTPYPELLPWPYLPPISRGQCCPDEFSVAASLNRHMILL